MDKIRLVEDLTDEDHYKNLLAIVDYPYSKWDRFGEEKSHLLVTYRQWVISRKDFNRKDDINSNVNHPQSDVIMFGKIYQIIGYKISWENGFGGRTV